MCAGYAAGVHKCILEFHDGTVSSGADFDHFEEEIDDTLAKWVRIATVRKDKVCTIMPEAYCYGYRLARAQAGHPTAGQYPLGT